MQYLKVNPSADNLRVSNNKSHFLIANELYTLKEALRLGIKADDYRLFTPVQISSRKTYFLFGARFQSDN